MGFGLKVRNHLGAMSVFQRNARSHTPEIGAPPPLTRRPGASAPDRARPRPVTPEACLRHDAGAMRWNRRAGWEVDALKRGRWQILPRPPSGPGAILCALWRGVMVRMKAHPTYDRIRWAELPTLRLLVHSVSIIANSDRLI